MQSNRSLKVRRNKQLLEVTDVTLNSLFEPNTSIPTLCPKLQKRSSNVATAIVNNDETGDVVLELVRHLHLFPSLHSLDFSSNLGLNKACADALTECLPLSTIVRLDLSSCHQVGNTVFFLPLLQTLLLPLHCTLTSLILRDVQLTDADFISLVSSITQLHTLDVSENLLTDESIDFLSSRLLETPIDSSNSSSTSNISTLDNSASVGGITSESKDTNDENASVRNLSVPDATTTPEYIGLGLHSLNIDQNNTRIQSSIELALIIPKLPNLNIFRFGHGIQTLKKSGGKGGGVNVATASKRLHMPCTNPLEVVRILILAVLNRETNNIMTTNIIIQHLLRAVPFDLLIQAISDMSLHEEQRKYNTTLTNNNEQQQQQPIIIPEQPLFWALHRELYLLVEEILLHNEYNKTITIHVKNGSKIKTSEGKLFNGTITFQMDYRLFDIDSMNKILQGDNKVSKSTKDDSKQDDTFNDLQQQQAQLKSLPKEVVVDTEKKALTILFRRPSSRSRRNNKTALHLALRSGNEKLILAILNKNKKSFTDIREKFPTETSKRSSRRKKLQRQSQQIGEKGNNLLLERSELSGKGKKAGTRSMLWIKHKLEIGPKNETVNSSFTLPSIFTLKAINTDIVGLNEEEFSTGFVPLRIACRLGMENVVNEMIALGADIQLAALSSPCSRTGSTALHEACLRGMTHFVNALLKCPVALSWSDKGIGNIMLVQPTVALDLMNRNSLIYSLMNSELSILEANLLSLSGGIDKESRKNQDKGTNLVLGQSDDCNRSALSFSVQWQCYEASKMLIQAGAQGLLEIQTTSDDDDNDNDEDAHHKNCWSRCLHRVRSSNLYWFVTLDMNWIADQLIVEDRLSPYAIALLRYDQASKLTEDEDNTTSSLSTPRNNDDKEDFDSEEDILDDDGDDGDDDGNTIVNGSKSIELVIISENESETKKNSSTRSLSSRRMSALSRHMQPKRADGMHRASIHFITADNKNVSARDEPKITTISKKSKKKDTFSQKSYEKELMDLRDIALHRIRQSALRSNNKLTNQSIADEANAQLNLYPKESAKTIEDVSDDLRLSPLDRKEVATSILRIFDNEEDVKSIRFHFALLRVREEATLYLMFFALVLLMSIILTVGDFSHIPIHYHRFLIASSDKVAAQDVPGLPPPNEDFFAIQSIDHWHLWMNGAVMPNLFPNIPNTTTTTTTNELHQNGLLDGSLIFLDHHVRIRQIRRRFVKCDVLTNELAKKDVGTSSLECLSTNYDTNDFIDSGDNEIFLNTKYSEDNGGLEVPWFAYSTTHQLYPSGGYVFTFNTLNPKESQEKWKNLSSSFIDDRTAAVFITYAIYNPHLKAVALVRCLTEFLPSKRNEPSMERKLLKTEHLFSNKNNVILFKDIIKIVFEILLAMLALRYLLVEFEELVGKKCCQCCQVFCCQSKKCSVSRKRGKRSKMKLKNKVNIWFHPLRWSWSSYCSKGWNIIDVFSSVIILLFCMMSIGVHYYKAKLNDLPSSSTTQASSTTPLNTLTQWKAIMLATDLSNIADDTLGFGFLIWGMKLFKVVQLVPLRAGRIFESIGHTLIADRVVVILLFIFVLMVIFTLSFYMMYSSNNSGYSTILSSFFSTYNNLLGNGDYEEQKTSNFVLGQLLWFVCVLTLTIIMLNIFIAVVSVEYESLEDEIESKFKNRIDKKLISLIKKRLRHCPSIGISKKNFKTSWVGIIHAGSDNSYDINNGIIQHNNDNDTIVPQFENLKKKDDEYQNIMYPLYWRNPPLPRPINVRRSKMEIFEQTASISDQLTKLSSIVKESITSTSKELNNSDIQNSNSIQKVLKKLGHIESLVRGGINNPNPGINGSGGGGISGGGGGGGGVVMVE
jgi:hypothetical protein